MKNLQEYTAKIEAMKQDISTALNDSTTAKKGYQIIGAEVRFILAWKDKDAAADEEENAIILPNLYLKRPKS